MRTRQGQHEQQQWSREEATHPVSLPEHESSQTMRSGRHEAWRTAHKPLIDNGTLQEVLGQGARVEIVVIRFTDAAQKAHGTRESQFEVEHIQHEPLGLEQVIGRVRTIHHVHHIRHGRGADLFVLGRDQQGRRSDQLKFADGHNLARQESVNVVGGQEERLGQQREAAMHLNKPIHKDRSHRPLDLRLDIHIMRVWQEPDLREFAMSVSVLTVATSPQR